MRLQPECVLLRDFYSDNVSLLFADLTSNTIQGYERAWRLRIAPTLGHLPLSDLRALTVLRAMNEWQGKQSTRNAAKSMLSQLLDLAVLDQRLTTNPVKALSRQRGKSRLSDLTERALSRAQVATMLDLTAFHPHGQRMLAALALTGARLGEVSALRAEHVDLENGLLRIRATRSPDGHGRVVERPTKSGHARDVPIIAEFEPWLRAALATDFPYLFSGSQGGPFDSTNLSRALRWSTIRPLIVTYTDGRPLRFHDLRHTFASRLSDLGLAPAYLQQVMGHASITTTERYTHTRSRDAALAAKRILDAQNSEVTFRGGETAATRGLTRENPRKSGGFDR